MTSSEPGAGPAVGLAVTTVGRPEVVELLGTAAASTLRPRAVAVADQSREGVQVDRERHSFEVLVVPSSGGASAGRNDAVRALGDRVDVLGFPNDDSRLPADTLERVASAFAADAEVVAVACALIESGSPRFRLPEPGVHLDPVSVWRAIEPATFVRASSFAAAGGFREDLGTGSAGPWQSGEITDLLLRLMAAGGKVLSRPDLAVVGRGERRGLSPAALAAKQRAYARGMGYVYRTHPYPWFVRWRTVAGPWRHPAAHAPELPVSLRLALVKTVGRVEGLLGRTLPGRGPSSWL